MCNHCAGNGDKLKDHYLTFHQKGKFTCSVEGCGRTYGSRHCTYNHFVREHTKLNSVGKYDTQSLKENVRIRSDAIKRDGFGKTSEKNLPEIEVTINKTRKRTANQLKKVAFFQNVFSNIDTLMTWTDIFKLLTRLKFTLNIDALF